MLIRPILKNADPALVGILTIIGRGTNPRPTEDRLGVYTQTHWNFGAYLPVGEWEESPDIGEFSGYGVCDSVEQFLESPLGVFLQGSPRRFVASLVRVSKVDQPLHGGWRWHKWGPYIGKHTPTEEYLYDEPGIAAVYTYHVYEKVVGA